MVYPNGTSAYRKTEVSTTTDPKKLIQMLYDGALRFLEKARIGTMQKEPKLRGENLGKALDIITELNSCLDIEKGGETAEYLREIYLYMLMELPKVNLNNNVEMIERAMRYIKELKRLWEERVMGLPDKSASINEHNVSEEIKPAVRKTLSVAI